MTLELARAAVLGDPAELGRGGHEDEPPAGGVKFKAPPLPEVKNFRRPPFHKFST